MSNSHKGSRLQLSGNPFVLDFQTEYHDFNRDESGIQFGSLVMPNSNSVFTIRPYEGLFGGGIAVEEGTTNLISNPMFDSNISGWGVGSNISTLNWSGGFNDIKSGVGYMYISGLSGNGFAQGPTYRGLISGSTYSVSAYVEGDGIDIYNKVTCGGTVFYSGSAFDDYTWSPNLHRYTKINDRGLYRIEITFSLNQGAHSGNVLDSFQPRIGLLSGNYINAKVYGYQFENKSFSTSIVNGTRAKGLLQYSDGGLNHLQGTIAFWYKPSILWTDTVTSNGSNEGSHDDLFTWGIPGQNNCIWGRNERENKAINFWYGPANCSYPTINLSGNNFTHIAFTWQQGGNATLYINGKSVATSGLGTQARPSTGYFEVGTRQGGSFPNANGIINDFIVSPTFMSAEDISSIYLSNRPLFNPYDKRTYAL